MDSTMPSTSIAILDQRRRQSTAESATSSTPSSSYSSSSSTPAPSPQSATERGKPQTKHVRRQSFLSQAFTQQECTTITIGDDPDGPLRLVTYVSYAQGFIWNPEIFVPSYCDFDYVPLEQRRDPVIEIHVSDEDARRILPHSS